MSRTLKSRCPLFGDEAHVRHDDTVLSLTPIPHLKWICGSCGDVHLWSLTPDRYDWLQMQRYDIASALSDDGPIFVSQKQSL